MTSYANENHTTHLLVLLHSIKRGLMNVLPVYSQKYIQLADIPNEQYDN